MTADLRQELDAIRDRLSAIETHLGLRRTVAADLPSTAEPPPLPVAAAALEASAPAPSVLEAPSPAATLPDADVEVVAIEAPASSVSGAANAAVVDCVPEEPSQAGWLTHALAAKRRYFESASPAGMPASIPDADGPQPPGQERESFEVWLGQRWLAWVGALILVLAAAFFVKLAYDEGWIGRLSPLAKCLVSAGFGAALVLAGEVALRRIGRLASVGLYGAGLGVLYLTAFASFRYFHLASEQGAFVLMAIVAQLGFTLTARARFAAIGVLSMIGGYFAPLLLRSAEVSPVALPFYLTFLLAIGLGLSTWAGASFRPLRVATLVLHGFIGLLWAVSEGRDHVTLAVGFTSLWWLMTTAEVARAAVLHRLPLSNASASLAATAWYVTLATWIFGPESADGRQYASLLCVAVSFAAGGLAFWLAGADGLRVPLSTGAPQRLALSLWLQVGILATAAVGLWFEGYGQSLGWVAIALAAIELGRRLPSRPVDYFGLVVGTLALGRIAVFDFHNRGLMDVLLTVGDVHFTEWGGIALLAATAAQVASRRIRCPGEPPWPLAALALSGLSVLAGMLIVVNQSSGLATTGGWLVLVALLLAAAPWGTSQRYALTGLAVLAVATVRWAVHDVALTRLNPAWSALDVWPFFNLQTGLAAVIVGLAFWCARRVQREAEAARTPDATPLSAYALLAATLLGSGLLLVALSFEIDRAVMRAAALQPGAWSTWHARQLLWTMLWALASAGLGLCVRWLLPGPEAAWPRRIVRWAATGVVGLCAVKWVVADTLLARVGYAAFAAAGGWPLLNLQMFTGLAVLAAVVLLALALRDAEPGEAPALGFDPKWLPVAAAVMTLWGLSFEIERLIVLLQSGGTAFAWHDIQVRWLGWIGLWAIGGLAMLEYARRRQHAPFAAAGMAILLLMGLAWLSAGTLMARVTWGLTCLTPMANLQFGVGVLLGFALWRALAGPRPAFADGDVNRLALGVAGIWVGCIGLWLGSLEIDRALSPEAGLIEYAAMARQSALSVYWGVFAIGLLAFGFYRRVPAARYAGLALLGIVLGKVMLLDLSAVRYAYRVLLLLVLGLMMIGASMGYARVARMRGANVS